jgi:large subunit ribosomal protein L6
MSRIGRSPIQIPSGVTVTLADDAVKVVGPKGELSEKVLSGVAVNIDGETLSVERQNDERISRGNHGLMRTLINNMVVGVTKGFEKKLVLTGVGYRVSVAGPDLKLKIGLSHEVNYKIPSDITISVEQNTIKVEGNSKQRVGQIAAEIRSYKKPEPYKGKGIAYENERILRKSGKSGKE